MSDTREEVGVREIMKQDDKEGGIGAGDAPVASGRGVLVDRTLTRLFPLKMIYVYAKNI